MRTGRIDAVSANPGFRELSIRMPLVYRTLVAVIVC